MLIEICPFEGLATLSDAPCETSQEFQDIKDCTASGDVESACQYILDCYAPKFHIVAKNSQGKYENRIATDREISATARQIYFDSDTDFDDIENAKLYLVWEMASGVFE